MTDELVAYMNSTAGLQDDPNLCLNSWHITVSPQHATLLGSDEDFKVGWISVGMDGGGYMFPLTHLDLVRRAEAHERLGALADLCRRTWPVTTARVKEPLWWYLPHKRKQHAQDMRGGRPSSRVRRARFAMGEAWPYELDAPSDWHWTIRETG